jgi:hypothetical protein
MGIKLYGSTCFRAVGAVTDVETIPHGEREREMSGFTTGIGDGLSNLG